METDESPLRWVSKKNVDWARVQELLAPCAVTNHYANRGCVTPYLETLLARVLDLEYGYSVIVTSSGHAALYALAATIALQKGDMRWGVQSFTFPASAQIPGNVEIVDIDESGGLDLLSVPPGTNGIVVTNPFGYVVDISKYEKYCHDNNIALMFDNAAAPLSRYNGKNICSFGDGSIISLHHTKPIGFGEGGAVIVRSHLAPTVRRVINFGIGLNDRDWSLLGINGKMSEVSAAFVVQYLEKNVELVKAHHSERLAQVQKFIADEGKSCGLTILPSFGETTIPSCICIVLNRDSERHIDLLNKEGIEARRYYKPLSEAPVARDLWSCIICIPCHQDVSESKMRKVLELLASAA
jgi:dTDP-4-amino-4,6-dideoxygalactose transaminase